MEVLKSILWEYRFIILWILSVIILCLTMGREWTKAKAYSLMLLAKQKAKEGFLKTGRQQEDFVVHALYLLLMKLKIPFITEEGLRPFIHRLYSKAMDYVDDGYINNSIQ